MGVLLLNVVPCNPLAKLASVKPGAHISYSGGGLHFLDGSQSLLKGGPLLGVVVHQSCGQLHVAGGCARQELQGAAVDGDSRDDLGLVHGGPGAHAVVHLPHQHAQGKGVRSLHNSPSTPHAELRL